MKLKAPALTCIPPVFVDFSSAVKTLQPHLTGNKLLQLDLDQECSNYGWSWCLRIDGVLQNKLRVIGAESYSPLMWLWKICWFPDVHVIFPTPHEHSISLGFHFSLKDISPLMKLALKWNKNSNRFCCTIYIYLFSIEIEACFCPDTILVRGRIPKHVTRLLLVQPCSQNVEPVVAHKSKGLSSSDPLDPVLPERLSRYSP